jgi:hypothetical protein
MEYAFAVTEHFAGKVRNTELQEAFALVASFLEDYVP